MSSSFFSDLDPVETAQAPKSSGSFFSDLPEEGQKSKYSKYSAAFEQAMKAKAPNYKGRDLRADLITAATSMAGLPGDVASLAIGENPLTSESLREKAFEQFPSLAPENEQQKQWDEGLSLVMGLGTPTAPLKAGAKLAGKGLSKIGIKTPGFLKSKYKELYEIGKSMGIDEKALAPFRHGKITEASLKQLSRLGKEAQQGVEFAEKLATPMYQAIDQAAANIPLSPMVQNFVSRSLGDIVRDIKKSPALVKESKDVIKFLNDAMANLKGKPASVESLTNLYRQLNKTVNWSSIKQAGKGHLVSEAKDAVIKDIYGMSPKIGKEFQNMNKLYGGYRQLAKEVSPHKLVEYASKGGPLGYVALALLTGNDAGDALKKGFGFFVGKKALGKISGKLLTDPKWVSLKEKLVKQVKNNSYTNLPKLFQAIKKKAEMSRIPLDEEED